MTKPPCTVWGVVATEANQAVMFRKGPKRLTQMLIWNFGSDEITLGQWISANVESADVTPDGQHLVISASRRDPQTFEHSCWTAISRPPYYTAIALWFCWRGEAKWKSNNEILLFDMRAPWIEKINPPPDLVVTKVSSASIVDHRKSAFLRSGWQAVSEEELAALRKADTARAEALYAEVRRDDKPRGELLKWFNREWKKSYSGHRPGIEAAFTRSLTHGKLLYESLDKGGRSSLLDLAGNTVRSWAGSNGPSWLDVDNSGRLVFAEAGCLWDWKKFPNGEPTLIADLNPHTFEQVEPPEWATRW